MAKRKKPKENVYEEHEIQQEAANLLNNTISALKDRVPEFFWSFRSEEDQRDKGIDGQYELVERKSGNTIYIFKVQNKGTRKELKRVQNGEFKGKISFQLSVKKAHYYFYQINVPLIFIVCDLAKNVVYYHSIQLDDSIPNKLADAKQKGTSSIQLYLEPSCVLHPDNDIHHFFSEVKQSFDVQFSRFNQYLDHPLFRTSEITIDRKLHLLDQLYIAIQAYYAEFSYIPPKELLKLYPFKSKPEGVTNYSGFTATVDSSDLYNLFVSIKNPAQIIDDEILKIEKYEEKSNTILRTLFANGIEYISSRRINEKVYIGYRSQVNQACQCCRCCYTRMDFVGSLKGSCKVENDDKLENILKKGWVQYKLANYVNAFRCFSKAASEAKKQRKWIFYAISLFNIKSLKAFIRNYSWEHPEYNQVIEEIGKIDFESKFAFLERQKVFGGDLLKWLIDETFFNQTYFKVTQTVKEIERHYYSQINGGWSNNSNVVNLLSELYQITSFLNYNFIIYDGFHNFSDLFEHACRGYVAGAAMHESQSSRLLHLNQNVIQQIILYGNPEVIKSHYERFRSKPFQLSTGKADSFLSNLLLRVLNSWNEAEQLDNLLEPGNSQFSQFRESFLSNLLMIISLSDVDNLNIAEVGEMICNQQEKYEVLHFKGMTWFRVFLQQKGAFIAFETYQKLLALSLKQGSLHDEKFIDVLVDEIRKHYPTLLLSELQAKTVCNIYLNKCSICGYSHPHQAVSIYWQISSDQAKVFIQKEILKVLDRKFEPSLFYIASIFDMIDPKVFLDQFIESAKPKKGNGAMKYAYEMEGTRYVGMIDSMVNLLFKLDYDLKDSKFDEYRSFSTYYSWLFNMEGFDYNYFDAMWLLRYPSVFYLERFSRIREIKVHLKLYLRKHDSPALLNIYLDYFSD